VIINEKQFIFVTIPPWENYACEFLGRYC